MSAHLPLPKLHVEGPDDISVVNALLFRHGLDTKKGQKHLHINAHQSVDTLLQVMPDAIRAATDLPVGFVVDIDIELSNRWNAVSGRLTEAGIVPPPDCPREGYIAQLPDYPCPFGIWLMPDCATDHLKLEHLCQTLIATNDPLWPLAGTCVSEAARVVDDANAKLPDECSRWKRFRDVDRIKSEIHTWLSWKDRPGEPLGAAINAHILGHDSPQAIAFLKWLKQLFSLSQLMIP